MSAYIFGHPWVCMHIELLVWLCLLFVPAQEYIRIINFKAFLHVLKWQQLKKMAKWDHRDFQGHLVFGLMTQIDLFIHSGILISS